MMMSPKEFRDNLDALRDLLAGKKAHIVMPGLDATIDPTVKGSIAMREFEKYRPTFVALLKAFEALEGKAKNAR